MRTCSISGCDGIHYGKGYCYKHWKRDHVKPEYTAWLSMKQRCYDTNYNNYKSWGGRGIKVCDEWKNDYAAFHKYMGDKPSPRHSLDRINNSKNYEPGNVRWANWWQQNTNKRISVSSGHHGIEKRYKNWRTRIMVNYKQINLGTYPTLEEAIKARKVAELKYAPK